MRIISQTLLVMLVTPAITHAQTTVTVDEPGIIGLVLAAAVLGIVSASRREK